MPALPHRTSNSGQVSAVIAGFLGWTLDAFDFFLVVFCLTAIAKDFGKTDAEMAFSITITLAFRPVGAFLFGLLADRYGRRLPLMLDLIFYSIVEVLSGFAPNYTTFLVLRALFGIGMGGEWGVGASLALEKVAPRWRGIVSGFLQQGYAIGNILAAACFYFFFKRFGWRPLFFIGGLPALLALFVRVQVKESEIWERSRAKNWAGLGRTLTQHWKLFLYLTLLMTAMNLSSHGTQDMYPTFLQRQWNFAPLERSAITAFSMVGAVVGGIGFGYISNRIGRRRAMIAAFAGALLAIPLWAFAPTVAGLVAGAFIIQFFVQGAWGVIPAHLAELSPNSIRGFLPGFSYQCGVLLSSGVVVMEAGFARHVSYSVAMALTALGVFTAAIVANVRGPERLGADFTTSTSGDSLGPLDPITSTGRNNRL